MEGISLMAILPVRTFTMRCGEKVSPEIYGFKYSSNLVLMIQNKFKLNDSPEW